MPAAKLHTIATLAAELRAMFPSLTEGADVILTRTLLREMCDFPSGNAWEQPPVESPVSTDDRRRILAFAKRKYV